MAEEHEVEVTDAQTPPDSAEQTAEQVDVAAAAAGESAEPEDAPGETAAALAEAAQAPGETAEAPGEAEGAFAGPTGEHISLAGEPGESAEPSEVLDVPAEEPTHAIERVSTGHDEIDAAMRRLDELDSLPVDQHGEILDELHGRLRDALAAAAAPSSGRSDD